jgi:N-acetylglucosaminyldiphosphoundecaprenol N-acetyl-beta-D-mannosaminyltransferase
VITANLDHLRQYARGGIAKDVLDRCDFVVADGMPLVWASRIAGVPLPERVAGSNLVWSISEVASRQGASIYLLGGNRGVALEAWSVLTKKFPDLRVAGAASPAFGFEHSVHALAEIEQALVESAPDIVFVALPFPKQELLIRRLRAALPYASYIGVGVSFSFVTGQIARAPLWLHRLGFEWLHRLAQEPRRLGGRYIRYGLPFAVRVLLSAVLYRFGLTCGADGKWGTGTEPSGRPDRLDSAE